MSQFTVPKPDGMLREPRFKEVRVDKTKGDV